jgi:gluconolactonase
MPELGTMTLLIDNVVGPNGLAFSADEKQIYISGSRRDHIRVFDLLPSGLLAKQTDRVFVDLCGPEPGTADGMKVDTAGNIYCGGSGGIWIMDSTDKKLGRIIHGQSAPTNVAFGGDDWKALFFTTYTALGEVKLKISGLPVPSGKRS